MLNVHQQLRHYGHDLRHYTQLNEDLFITVSLDTLSASLLPLCYRVSTPAPPCVHVLSLHSFISSSSHPRPMSLFPRFSAPIFPCSHVLSSRSHASSTSTTAFHCSCHSIYFPARRNHGRASCQWEVDPEKMYIRYIVTQTSATLVHQDHSSSSTNTCLQRGSCFVMMVSF